MHRNMVKAEILSGNSLTQALLLVMVVMKGRIKPKTDSGEWRRLFEGIRTGSTPQDAVPGEILLSKLLATLHAETSVHRLAVKTAVEMLLAEHAELTAKIESLKETDTPFSRSAATQAETEQFSLFETIVALKGLLGESFNYEDIDSQNADKPVEMEFGHLGMLGEIAKSIAECLDGCANMFQEVAPAEIRELADLWRKFSLETKLSSDVFHKTYRHLNTIQDSGWTGSETAKQIVATFDRFFAKYLPKQE